MKILPALLLYAGLLCYVPHLQAQVSLDSSFTTPGFFITQSPYNVSATAAQPDGKMIVAGNFIRYNNKPSTNLVRLFPDGTRDTTFSAVAKTNGDITKIEVLPNGKIVLGGAFNTFKNTFIDHNVIRLNANGTLDSTFTAASHIRHGWVSVEQMRAQPDGKVILYGYGMMPNTAGTALVRLNADGSMDTSFHADPQLKPDESITALEPVANGALYVAGTFATFNGQAKPNLVRLLPNGKVDPNFTTPGFSHIYPQQPPYLTALLYQKDGTLLVGGSFYNCGAFASRGLVRLKNNGSVDSSFQVSYNYMPQHIAKLDTTGGKLTAGGLFNADGNQFMLLRFTNSGHLDNTFSQTISDRRYNTSYNLQTFVTLPDKSIVIGGNFGVYYGGNYFTGIAHYSASGVFDTTVNAVFQRIGSVYKTLVTGNGNIMVGGAFDFYGNTPVNNLVRLFPSGLLDSSFETRTGPDAIVTQIAETADSLLLIAGGFQKVGGTTANGIARLLKNGKPDPNFSTGTGPDFAEVYSILALPNGKVLAGGAFQTFNGYASRGLVRLLRNGSVDATFRTPVPTPWYSIGTLALLANNNVLAGDNITPTQPDFSAPLRVWKINQNGAVDSGFATENQSGFPISNKLAVTPNQRIYYSGEVLKPGANPNSYFFTQKLLQLRADGRTDSSSKNFLGTFYVSDFKTLGDTAILACGRNLGWNDSANYIMRFNPDLTIDSTFNPIALYYNLRTLDCMADGRIVVAGEPVRFFNFETEQIPNIAVLNSPSLEVVANKKLVTNVAGTVDAGSTSQTTRTQLKIVNTGSTTAQLGNGTGKIAVIEGANAASFSISNNTITALKPHDSLLLTVTFAPTAVGQQSAQITIPYNNGIRQRYTFTVNATGTSVVTAVPDVQANKSTLVFPNPTTGQFYAKSSLYNYSMYVYDALGRQVLEKHKQPANGLVPVALSTNSKGMYWVVFKTKTATVIRQVLIQ